MIHEAVVIICSECGTGRYVSGLGGGQCESCGHCVAWRDITLDDGESMAVVHSGDSPNGAFLGYHPARVSA